MRTGTRSGDESMIPIKPDLSTEENRKYWAFVRKTKKEVEAWPWWKRPRGEERDMDERYNNRVLWAVSDENDEYFEIRARIRKDCGSYEGLKIAMVTHIVPTMRAYFDPFYEDEDES